MSAIPAIQSTTRAKARTNTQVRSRTATQLLTFGVVAFVTYGISSMCGQVLLEGARQERIASTRVAADMKAEISSLDRQVNGLTNYLVVSDWAGAHGLVSLVLSPEPKDEARVASR